MKKYYAFSLLQLLLWLLTIQLSSFSQYDYRWQTDGNVNTAVINNNTLYIGGTFTYVGQYTGNFAALDISTGLRNAAWPLINNDIHAITSDGNGGWYIGGNFLQAGTTSCTRLIHMKADKTIDPQFKPMVNASIYTICVSNGVVYIGGNFTQVNGQTRNHIAALDAVTGVLTSWNPDIDNQVNDITEYNGVIYTCGNFTKVGGNSHTYIAAINSTTGIPDTWNPVMASAGSGSIRTLCIYNDVLYVGGYFISIDAQPRTNLASFDLLTGAVTSWAPNTNGPLQSVHEANGTLYIGGSFSVVAGQTRRNIASFNPATGVLTGWDPNCNSIVNKIIVSGNTAYVAGQFSAIGGQTRRKIAAIDITVNTNNALPWDPNAGNGWEVLGMAVSPQEVFIGGSFTSVNGYYRNRLAAVDLLTNTITNWDPNSNNAVQTLCIKNNIVYAGGDFSIMGGQLRSRLAAIDAATAAVSNWNPGASATVRTIATSTTGDTIYAGGDFTTAGSQPRNYIAAFSSTNNTALDWNAVANATVRTLAIDNNTVYAGGDFTSIGGQTRNRIAALDATIAVGNALSWDANANNVVRTLAIGNGTVYAGGDFTSIGGQSRNRIAALTTGGAANAWNPGANSTVRSIAVNGSVIYVTGDFGNIGGQSHWSIAALDAGINTNNALAWQPVTQPGFSVNTITANNSIVYAGGSYTTIDVSRSFFLSYLPGMGGILPDKLSFAVQKEKGGNYIQWTNLSLPGTVIYELQKSNNGYEYKTIFTKEALSGNHFDYTDRDIETGSVWYRLRINSAGAGNSYSKVIKVSAAFHSSPVLPGLIVRGTGLPVHADNPNSQLCFYTTNGSLVGAYNLQKGYNFISTRLLPAGLLFYIVNSYSKQPVQSGRIVVQ